MVREGVMLDEPQDLFERAVMLVWAEKKASTSFIQRRLAIGYNKASRLIEQMEKMGIVSAANHVGKREVRSPDDMRHALRIRDEVWSIAEGDGAQARIMFNALISGLNTNDEETQNAPAASAASTNIISALRGENDKLRRAAGVPPMKPDPEFDKMSDDAYSVTAEELRQFIERFERLDAEKKDITDQQKEVMSEAKARGYDSKVLKKIIALRKREPDEIAEEEAVLDLYKAALGMD
jgi:uncharacterized protein (UPF0335 family)